MARGYLIGENYRDRIDRTITRVDGMTDGPGSFTIPTRLQDIGGGGNGKVFRICTYTGAWSIGSSKTVSFKYQTATPNTVSATNLFFPVTNTATGDRDCAIAKDGTAWFLVDVPFVEVDVLIGASLTTAGLQFTRARVAVASSATLSITTISTKAC